MKFELDINMDNAAMSHKRHVADALRQVAADLDKGIERGVIRDANGNNVGYFEVLDGGNEELRREAAYAIAEADIKNGHGLDTLVSFLKDKMEGWPRHRILSEVKDVNPDKWEELR